LIFVRIGGVFEQVGGYYCGIYWFIRGVIGWFIGRVGGCWCMLIDMLVVWCFFVILVDVGDLNFLIFIF
jgi:hypothetical protein